MCCSERRHVAVNAVMLQQAIASCMEQWYVMAKNHASYLCSSGLGRINHVRGPRLRLPRGPCCYRK